MVKSMKDEKLQSSRYGGLETLAIRNRPPGSGGPAPRCRGSFIASCGFLRRSARSVPGCFPWSSSSQLQDARNLCWRRSKDWMPISSQSPRWSTVANRLGLAWFYSLFACRPRATFWSSECLTMTTTPSRYTRALRAAKWTKRTRWAS